MICDICTITLGDCYCRARLQPPGNCPCEAGYYVYNNIPYCCKCWFDSGKAKECADEHLKDFNISG